MAFLHAVIQGAKLFLLCASANPEALVIIHWGWQERKESIREGAYASSIKPATFAHVRSVKETPQGATLRHRG